MRSPGSRGGRRAARADPDAHRGGVPLEPLDACLAQQHALAAGAILHQQDRGFDLARAAPLQHRRLDQLGAHGSHGEAEQQDETPEQTRHAAVADVVGVAPPEPGERDRGEQKTERPRPDRRLDRERKVHGDPGAEPHGQPQEPTLALGQQVVGEPGREVPCDRRAACAAAQQADRRAVERAVRHRDRCARPRADIGAS
jgi:hypothetical protein